MTDHSSRTTPPDTQPSNVRNYLCVVAAPKEFEAVATGMGADPVQGVSSDALPWIPQALAEFKQPTPSTTPTDPEADPNADPNEVRFGHRARFRIIQSGVGPAAAAAATAALLARDPAEYNAVCSLGIAGMLESAGRSGPQTILATESIFADLGIQTPAAYQTTTQMGFPPSITGQSIPIDPVLQRLLMTLADRQGPVATVSTCSGTDLAARSIAQRTAAIAEAMEGAAVASVAQQFSIPFAEFRVLSNTTGDRDAQQWWLDDALDRLQSLASGIASRLSQSAAS